MFVRNVDYEKFREWMTGNGWESTSTADKNGIVFFDVWLRDGFQIQTSMDIFQMLSLFHEIPETIIKAEMCV